MSKFRVKLDMSEFYEDDRSLAYVLVDPKWEHVLCLQQHVQKLFKVSISNFKTDDGVFIPPLESIEIVKSSDILKANPESKEKKRSLSSAKAVTEDFLQLNGTKRKSDQEKMSCSTPNLRPIKKQKTSDLDVTVVKMKKPDSSTKQCSVDNNTVTIENSNGLNGSQDPMVNEETAKCRKRKRIRKNKKDEELNVENKSSRLSSVPVPISSSTLRLSKSLSTPNKSPNHIHFDDDPANPEPVSTVKTIFHCRLNVNGPLIPREVAAEEVQTIPSPKKPKIQIHENILLVKAGEDNQDKLCDSSVIEIEDSLVATETGENQDFSLMDDNSIEKILPLSEPLVDVPSVGDIVLFKVYRLSDAGTPEVSEYVCGRCELVDPALKTIRCLLLDGLDQIADEDKISTNGGLSVAEFCLDQLFEKRIFKMS